MNNPIKKFVCGATAAVMLTVAVPMARAATPFTDVPSDSWYVNFVDYAYNHKLMAGTSDTTFSPNQTMTRGMLVTVLHSIAGKPSHSGSNPFSDVGDAWYRNAVLWCYENGIVAGTSATTFSPNSPITREQMVAILFKFAAANGLDTSSRSTQLDSYQDVNQLSGWAKDAFSWAICNGVISGTSATKLSPKDGATRAECAVVLQRYHELLNTQPTEPDVTEPETTTPEATEPEETVHVHTWEQIHHEEVGHWGERTLVCSCGWTCTESQAKAEGMALAKYWMVKHQNPQLEESGVRHSYDEKCDWIVDTPAYDTWKCSECGEERDTQPTEPDVTEPAPTEPPHRHQWVHVAAVTHGVFKCSCGEVFTDEDAYMDHWEDTGCTHSYDEGTVVDEPEYWKCSGCGEIRDTRP